MTKDKLERLLSEDEVRGIIGHAEALRTSDKIDTAQKFGSLSLREGTSVPHLYEIAQDVGIPQTYVERAMAFRYPSYQDMRTDLEEIGAKPTGELVSKVYIKNLILSLERKFPFDSFRWTNIDNYWNFHIYRDFLATRERLFGKGTKQVTDTEDLAKVNLVYVQRGQNKIRLHIYSPMFIIACKETLNNLNKRFEFNNMDATFHYDIYGDEGF